MWCSAAEAHLKLVDRAVSGARFLTGDVFVERQIKIIIIEKLLIIINDVSEWFPVNV